MDFDLMAFYETYLKYCLHHKERSEAFEVAKVSCTAWYICVIMFFVVVLCSQSLLTMFSSRKGPPATDYDFQIIEGKLPQDQNRGCFEVVLN
jgi:hypothetical protein